MAVRSTVGPMPSSETLAVFSVAALLFAVVPGPAVIYVVTRSVSQGRGAGVVSALGIETGNLVHVVAATLGLSAVLASSAVAYSVVKYLGAAYLVYLGVRTLLDRHSSDRPTTAVHRSLRHLYGQGVVVAILNPKTALFFLAFLPQFVEPGSSSVAMQVVILGVVLTAITAATDTCWALLAGTAAGWLRATPRRVQRQRIATGGIYVGLGLAAALTGDRPNRG
jgi:threonine/homoserine/homoserine lactone efflux protein